MPRNTNGQSSSKASKTQPVARGKKVSSGAVPPGIAATAKLDKVIRALVAVSLILVLADLFVHKHGDFEIEHLFGFYAVLGFLGSVGLLIAARWVQIVVTRPETYYDR